MPADLCCRSSADMDCQFSRHGHDDRVSIERQQEGNSKGNHNISSREDDSTGRQNI
ncbi:MAG: hypothetical protein NC308_02870 [Clostridium sp.]|nr:hypothetical protein [Clostridium sp.]